MANILLGVFQQVSGVQMEIALLMILFVVAYLFYIQNLDEPKRRVREKKFSNVSKLHPDLKCLIDEDKKIEAIKEYRRIYGAGLKEAHDVICKHLPQNT
ncbi:hypothetical protein [uncultured Paraglaciecola sp.]|uniref:hypothetical protein n=1 Tax=uncultured Paraglaciecola sp. TaxID=1765024 RepID=UPI0025995A29|nr:hypothetical protein [uncultured Paraglaciecola sp.]